MARQLDDLGVDIFEAGFAISSEDDFQAVSRLMRSAAPSLPLWPAQASRTSTRLGRPGNRRRPRIHVFLASSTCISNAS